jgi:hypothetical protein
MPIVGSLDEHADAWATVRPTVLRNIIERKTGAWSKRYGYRLIGRNVVDADGVTSATPPDPLTLCTHGGELIRIGAGGAAAAFQPLGAASSWVARGKAPEAVGRVVDAASVTPGAAAGFFADPSVATGTANGETFAAVAYVGVDASAAQFVLQVDVVNMTTGVRARTAFARFASAGLVLCPRVAISGDALSVWCYDAAGGVIRGYVTSLTTLTPWTSGSLATSASVFDVQAILGGSEFLVLYRNGGGMVTLTAVDASFAVVSTVSTVAATTLSAVSLRYTADRVWMVWGENDGVNFRVRAQTATRGPVALQSAVCNVRTFASGGAPLNVGVEQETATTARVAWTFAGDATDYGGARHALVTFSLPTTLTAGTIYAVRDAMWVSRPFVVAGTPYALACTVHGTHGTHVLLDLTAPAAAASQRIVGIVGVRQSAAIRTYGTNWLTNNLPRYLAVSDVATDGAGTYYVATTRSVPAAGVATLEWRFNEAWERTVTQAGSGLALSGGVVSVYDGSTIFDACFLSEPDILRCGAAPAHGLTAAGGGSLTPSATYSYAYVYAWTDATGARHRSAPSAAATITLGGAQTRVDGTVPPLHLTNKFDGAHANTGPTVTVEIYRTLADGKVFYRHSEVANVVNAAPVAFADTKADSEISSNEPLYTHRGVAHGAIPSASVVRTWREALCLGGTDDGSVFFSKPLVAGDGPGFSGALSQAPFPGGAVTDLFDLDGTLVVAKSDSLWRIDGDPPADDGTSSLTSPQRMAVTDGVVSPSGTLAVTDGVVFMSRRGLCLLDRGFVVSFVGAGVVASVPPGTRFAGCGVLGSQGLARWCVRGSRVAVTLDLFHSALRQQPQWTVDWLRDATTADEVANVLGACTWRDTFVWIGGAPVGAPTGYSGLLYQEDPTAHYDHDGGGTQRGIYCAVELAFERAAGPQGFHRVTDVAVLAEKVSSTGLRVTVTSDQDSQSKTWTSAEVDALPDLPKVQVKIKPRAQKVQQMRVLVEDVAPSGAIGTGAALTLRSVVARVGIKPGLARTAPAARK